MIRNIIVSIRDWYLVHIKWKNYKFGKNFHAGRDVFLWAKDHISIGDNCYIGRNSQIECNATIGDNVIIANSVALIGRYDHNYKQIGTSIRESSQIRDDDYNWLELDKEVFIGNDVWIGYGAIILSGVKIMDGSIISAGAVVTKDTKPYGIYGGVPAKRLSDRFDSKKDLEKHIKQLQNKNNKETE
jgi:acetyltransferase-like isoleucine patch superfamily enzyme